MREIPVEVSLKRGLSLDTYRKQRSVKKDPFANRDLKDIEAEISNFMKNVSKT